jgi:hypothetical protein
MMLTGLTGEEDEEEDDLRRISRLLAEQHDDLHLQYRRRLLDTLRAVIERPRLPPWYQ